METALLILAVLGFAAVGLRACRAALRIGRQGADALLARELAERRAERGDLTGMAEAEAWRDRARRARTRALCEFGLSAALLAVPPLVLASPIGPYAAYSILWLPQTRPQAPSSPPAA